MGRRKIEIKAIKEERNRSVTFLKRKGGLFKKAHELSVLCSVDIAVIIFGSNKKLYEYSSSDMNDILGRYSYYETPHEHKGPSDFQGKGGSMDDDDDDMDMGSPPPEAQEHMMPPHAHMHHPGLPHINSRQPTASASPPIHARNIGMPGAYPPQNRGTPQPGHSRPSSRNTIRRVSQPSMAHQHPQQAPPPNQKGYAYMPGPPQMYSHNQQAPMQQNMTDVQGHQYNGHQPPQQAHYMQDSQRRQSMPPAFPQARPDGTPDNSPPMPTAEIQPPLLEPPKRAPTKSRSMFTPIVGPDSVLLQHFFPQSQDNTRAHSIDVGSVSRSNAVPQERKPTPPVKTEERLPSPKAAHTTPPTVPPPAPIEPSQPVPPPAPQRTNSLRPRLTVTIPSEQSEGDAATADSSPGGGTATAVGNPQPPTSRPSDPPPGSVVLPPPSPSVTLLSAGATGPVNPFAPRPPPTTNGPPPEQTPISALPSRFLSGDGLLPSPSTFFADWNIPFGRNGNGGDNMLPSPLNFQTPVVGTSSHNIFKEDGENSSKRKSPTLDSPEATTATAKKVKV